MPMISLKRFLPLLQVIHLENIHSMQKAPRTFELTSCLSGKEDKWWRARKETPSFSIETNPPLPGLPCLFFPDLFLFSRIVILDVTQFVHFFKLRSRHFFNINRHKSPFLTLYHQVPSNTNLY